jgi:hypothetical protein
MAKAPFWSTQNTDPKRKFRWVVRFTNADQEILQLAAKNVKKPNYEIGSTAHKWLNHTFYFPARLEWKEISLSLVDIGGTKDVTTIIDAITKAAGYQSPTDADACKVAITKQKSVQAFGNLFEIIQLDGDGQDVEKWTLFNPWVKMVDFGELSYDDDALVELALTIQYDYAEKDASTRSRTISALGAAVGRALGQ